MDGFQNDDASGLLESRYAEPPNIERPRYSDFATLFAMPCINQFA